MATQVTTLRMEQKFKKTPVGEIPIDWDIVQLGDVATQSEERFEPTASDQRHYIGLEHISSGDGRLLAIGNSKAVSSLKTVFHNGDILFGKLRPNLRKAAFAPFDGVCSTDIIVIRPSDTVSSKFLFYRLQSAEAFAFAVEMSAGTKMPRTSWSLFRNYTFPCPPVVEQHRIAEILLAVDEAIDKTTTVIEKTQELRKSLMQQLLTRGIGHRNFKKTPIGEIPVNWIAEKLGDLCIGRPEYGATVPAMPFQGDLPRYVRITDVTDDGLLASEDMRSIKREDALPYLLAEGDILFARSGATVGKTYLYHKADGECAFAGYMIRFRTNKDRLLPEFLFQITHSDIYHLWVEGMFRAGAQPNINAAEYTDFVLPVPPVEEQAKIIEILSAVDAIMYNDVKLKQRMERNKKALMQVLLAGKVRVTR